MAEYVSKEAAVGNGYLSDWYISSVSNESPVWTDEHIDELLNDFIVIPKDTPSADVQPVDRWISTKDRLPDEIQDKSIYSGQTEEIRPSESVLVLTTGGSYDVAWYSYVSNTWTADNGTHTYENQKIAFWQPLPQPPKGGDVE